jgi:hypothetical protein
MQAKPGHFRYLGKPIILFPGRDGLLHEHLSPLLRPDANTVAYRTNHYLLHRHLKGLFLL